MKRLTGSVIFFFAFQSFLVNSANADSYALLINGGIDKSSNGIGFYKDLQTFHSALISSGVNRQNIYVLNSDGGSGPSDDAYRLENGEYVPVRTSPSLENDQIKDVKAAATHANVDEAFSKLAAKMKPNDHLTIFVTDHGSVTRGISLWDNDSFSVSDLRSALARLPPGATVQFVSDICFGGQFLSLTSENGHYCAVTSVDSIHTSTSPFKKEGEHSEFLSGIASGLQERKTGLYEAYLRGIDRDHFNSTQETSIDWFIAQRLHPLDFLYQSHCKASDSSLASLRAQIETLASVVDNSGEAKKRAYEKYLKGRVTDLRSAITSFQDSFSEFLANSYTAAHQKLENEWNSLSSSRKDSQRSLYTKLFKKLNSLRHKQAIRIASLESQYKKTIDELQFLAHANPQELNSYLNIRSCLESHP